MLPTALGKADCPKAERYKEASVSHRLGYQSMVPFECNVRRTSNLSKEQLIRADGILSIPRPIETHTQYFDNLAI